MLDLVLENERHVDETGAPGSSGSKTTRLWKSEGWEGYLIASDSLHDQAEKPHPRLYGTFPHVLARISHGPRQQDESRRIWRTYGD